MHSHTNIKYILDNYVIFSKVLGFLCSGNQATIQVWDFRISHNEWQVFFIKNAPFLQRDYCVKQDGKFS